MIEKMFAMEIALEVAPLHGIDIIADWQKNNAGARIATDRYRAGSLESCMPAMCLLESSPEKTERLLSRHKSRIPGGHTTSRANDSFSFDLGFANGRSCPSRVTGKGTLRVAMSSRSPEAN